jgi:tetratricopeptide (TPR) repeat protein
LPIAPVDFVVKSFGVIACHNDVPQACLWAMRIEREVHVKRHLGAVLFAITLPIAPVELGNASGGGPTSNSDSPAGTVTSELQNATGAAKAEYYRGLSLLRKAQMYDAEAAKSPTPEKSANARNKGQKAYGESLGAFINTVTIQPKLYQAWNCLGIANLHLGNYDDAISAYTKVLELNPNSPEAVENRAEAFLGLNQTDDAKTAYMALYRDSPALAKDLMTSLRHWVDAHRLNAQDVSPADVEALAKWIDERAAIAAQTANR